MPPQRQAQAVADIEEARAKRKVTEAEVELVWEPPPSSKSGRQGIHEKLQPLLEQLRAKPGEWARLATWPAATSAGSAAKKMSAKTEGYEFTARTSDAGSALYGRFMGDASP